MIWRLQSIPCVRSQDRAYLGELGPSGEFPDTMLCLAHVNPPVSAGSILWTPRWKLLNALSADLGGRQSPVRVNPIEFPPPPFLRVWDNLG